MSNKFHINAKSENPVCNTIVTCTNTCTLSDERSVNGGSLFISLIKIHIESVISMTQTRVDYAAYSMLYL